jgi:Na+-transporting methylmalonyl-CoA/oxaloacetate decarboxylase gamma subunit
MSNLMTALEITALGMGLVFAAIILLWWIMALLTFITADKESASHPAAPVSIMDNEHKARVAALAVAFALAQQEMENAHPLSDPPTALVSAWQLGMRTKQLYQKGERLNRQPRKIGS